MNRWLLFDSSGQGVQTVSCPGQDAERLAADLSLGCIELPEGGSDATHYVDVATMQLVALVSRPTPSHRWDWSARAWVPDLEEARSTVKSRIEQERQRRNLAPVLYDGKRLDGDATAQKNLADKLAGVQQRIRLGVGMVPELMVWKDADNVVHAWTDLQTYCDWLAGYVIALEDRGTRLYAAAWQHKAALDTLTDIDAILAYDISVGWPG